MVHDVQPSAVAGLVKDGAAGVVSLKEMVKEMVLRLGPPRTVWLMVPAAVVDRALGAPVPLLGAVDTVTDGGNLYYRDDMRRGRQLQSRCIQYLDVGTSGGVAGLERGGCPMIGGEGGVDEHLRRSLFSWRRASRLQRALQVVTQMRVRPKKASCSAARMGQGTSSR